MIEVEGVTCRYGRDGERGDVAAVDGVSLAVPDGEFLIVAGANGSGKTTLVRTFNGLVEPDEGRVAVNGTPVEADLVAARTAVGMVFQDPRDQFVAATVGADVAFGPENLERVAIAGALAMEPDHLVLDEPFTGLDEPARRSVVDRLRALRREGTGVVVVTHDLRDVFGLADRVVGLSDGRVGVDAPPDAAAESLPGLDVRVPDRAADEPRASDG